MNRRSSLRTWDQKVQKCVSFFFFVKVDGLGLLDGPLECIWLIVQPQTEELQATKLL